MKNLVLSLVFTAVALFVGTKWKLHNDVESGVDMIVMMVSPYADVTYSGVSSTLSGELTIDNIEVHITGYEDAYRIRRFGIDTPSFLTLMKLGNIETVFTSGDDFLPEYFGIIIEGFQLPSNADFVRDIYTQRVESLGVDDAEEPANACTGKYAMSPKALAAMGYYEYDLSLNARFRQLGSRYAVEIESSAADMWAIDAELILVGDMILEFAKGPRYRPKMSELHVEYTDLSLNGRVADYCRRLGLSGEEVVSAQLDAFSFKGREYGIEFDEYVIDPYIDFLDGKQTFIVTAKPTDPVTLSQISLYNPKDVPALLQLSAEVR